MGFFDASTGDLFTFWKSKEPITDLVGEGTSARMYAQGAKAGEPMPFLVAIPTGGQDHRHLSGVSGVRRQVAQVIACGATQAAADALAEVVRAETGDYRGIMGASWVNQVLQETAPESGYDPPADGSQQGRYWTMIRYSFTYTPEGASE